MKSTSWQQPLPWVFLALLLAVVTREWVWTPAMISGESMEPTLHSGQLVGVNKLAYLFRKPRRGDLVEVKTGRGLMVKRLIGLPGEEIGLRAGKFYIDGVALTEPYVNFHEERNIGTGRLAPDCFLVAGDNRAGSVIAVIKRERIVGEVMRRKPALKRNSG